MSKEPIKQSMPKQGGKMEESHPAFGLIKLSKCRGNQGQMFGNSIPNCRSFVSISIHQATRQHDGYDTYLPGEEIVRLNMSEAQFAEMMSTWNSGTGTPVTIRSFNGKSVPDIEEERMEADRVRDHFLKESELAIQSIRAAKRDINELLNKKSLTRADRDAIRDAVRKVESWASDSAPFIAELFDEAAKKTVSNAKIEINAFARNSLIGAGMDQAKSPPQLMGNTGDGNEETDNSKGR